MVQTPLKPLKPLTLEEFLTLPETKPASEFVDGQIIQKPLTQGKHSTIQGDFGATVNAQLKPNRIARVYPELRCTFGGRSIVPDLAVFTWERIPRDAEGKVLNTFSIAPDWTICFQQRYANEILSPGQSQTKVVRNILHCLDHGAQMGWMIDPEEEMIFVYFADRTIVIFEARSQQLPVPDFAAVIELTIGQIFGWLED